MYIFVFFLYFYWLIFELAIVELLFSFSAEEELSLLRN